MPGGTLDSSVPILISQKVAYQYQVCFQLLEQAYLINGILWNTLNSRMCMQEQDNYEGGSTY